MNFVFFLFLLPVLCFGSHEEKAQSVSKINATALILPQDVSKINATALILPQNVSKINATALISSLTDANPENVLEVRGLVDDLIAAGEVDRATATTARDDAQGVKDAAGTSLQTATEQHTQTAGDLVSAQEEEGRLTTLEDSKRVAKEVADDAKSAAGDALTAAQGHLDTETIRLDEEKATLERILELLDSLNGGGNENGGGGTDIDCEYFLSKSDVGLFSQDWEAEFLANDGNRFTFNCPAGCDATWQSGGEHPKSGNGRQTWGSGPFTWDSGICNAKKFLTGSSQGSVTVEIIGKWGTSGKINDDQSFKNGHQHDIWVRNYWGGYAAFNIM